MTRCCCCCYNGISSKRRLPSTSLSKRLPTTRDWILWRQKCDAGCHITASIGNVSTRIMLLEWHVNNKMFHIVAAGLTTSPFPDQCQRHSLSTSTSSCRKVGGLIAVSSTQRHGTPVPRLRLVLSCLINAAYWFSPRYGIRRSTRMQQTPIAPMTDHRFICILAYTWCAWNAYNRPFNRFSVSRTTYISPVWHDISSDCVCVWYVFCWRAKQAWILNSSNNVGLFQSINHILLRNSIRKKTDG